MVQIDSQFLLVSLAIIGISFLIDIVFGEPRNSIHPVVMIGKIISFFEKPLRKMKNQVLGGILLLAFTEAVILLILYAVLFLTGFVFVIYLIAAGFLLKTSFAMTSMGSHVDPIVRSLDSGDLESARRHLSLVVRRNTADLDLHGICSASIETISEGFVDGFASALFYFPYFSVFGAMFARVTSTLDSTVGYKDERNIRFGRASAVADTAVNYIPARLSGYIILLSSRLITGRREKKSLVAVSRKTESRNAGWPMGAIAIGMGVRLEKRGSYILNDDGKDPEIHDVRTAMVIFYLSAFIFLLVFVIAPVLLLSIIL